MRDIHLICDWSKCQRANDKKMAATTTTKSTIQIRITPLRFVLHFSSSFFVDQSFIRSLHIRFSLGSFLPSFVCVLLFLSLPMNRICIENHICGKLFFSFSAISSFANDYNDRQQTTKSSYGTKENEKKCRGSRIFHEFIWGFCFAFSHRGENRKKMEIDTQSKWKCK